jgi:hypothetical protein
MEARYYCYYTSLLDKPVVRVFSVVKFMHVSPVNTAEEALLCSCGDHRVLAPGELCICYFDLTAWYDKLPVLSYALCIQ